jgi:hypothetical protein
VKKITKYFAKRGKLYTQYFDPKNQFMRGKILMGVGIHLIHLKQSTVKTTIARAMHGNIHG